MRPIGGYTRQYQVNLDPNRLRAYGIPVSRVVEAVRAGNDESSGRLLEFGGTEYMVRGRGYARSLEDFENIPLSVTDTGSQIRIKDVGQVVMGPDLRRGVADLDGTGEVVSGIVIMRNGENALDVIDRVKAKIKEIEPGFPAGVKLVPVYDRSELIHNTIGTVKTTILEVAITVVLIILVFLWHFPSAAIPIATMPIAVLLAFIPFRMMGISANIMSLAGVAIAFSELVDASIVVVEQTHKKLEQWQKAGRVGDCRAVVISAIKEVAGPTFFSLLVIAVSFLPVLTLQAQEGRMFRPLAYTKTLTMLVAALLAITLDPALRLLLTRVERFDFRPRWLCRVANAVLIGQVKSEDRHPISRRLIRVYEPVVRWTLRWKWLVIGAARRHWCSSPYRSSRTWGRRPCRRSTKARFLYMPTTLPGISIRQAEQLLQVSDRIIRQFPEVDQRAWQSGARGDRHRSGAALDARDGNRPEAAFGVAARRYLVFLLGAGMGEERLPPLHSRYDLDRGTGRPDERRAEASRRQQLVDHADPRAHRHADHRHPDPGRAEDSRRGLAAASRKSAPKSNRC